MAAIFPFTIAPGIDLQAPLQQVLAADGDLTDGAFELEGVPLIDSIDWLNELLGDLVPPIPPSDWGREVLLYPGYVNGQDPSAIPSAQSFGAWDNRFTGVVTSDGVLAGIPVTETISNQDSTTIEGWLYLAEDRDIFSVKMNGVLRLQTSLGPVKTATVPITVMSGNMTVMFQPPVEYIPPTIGRPFSAYKIGRFTLTVTGEPNATITDFDADPEFTIEVLNSGMSMVGGASIPLFVDSDAPTIIMPTPAVTALTAPELYRSGIAYYTYLDQFFVDFGFAGVFKDTHQPNKVVEVLNGFLGPDFDIPASAFHAEPEVGDTAEAVAYPFQVGNIVSWTNSASLTMRGVDGGRNFSPWTNPSSGGPFRIDNLWLDGSSVKDLPATIDGGNGTLNAYDLFYDETGPNALVEGVRMNGHLNGGRVEPGSFDDFDPELSRNGTASAQVKYGRLVYPEDYTMSPLGGSTVYIFESVELTNNKANFYVVLDSLAGVVGENDLTIEVQNLTWATGWTEISSLRQNPIVNPDRKYTAGRYLFDGSGFFSNRFRLRITIPPTFTAGINALGLYLV